jgi:hypothetical protein
VLASVALVGLSGCVTIQTSGSEASTAGQSAVSVDSSGEASVGEYKAQMTDLGEREADLVERYGSVTGENYQDDATTYGVLIELLPDIQSFITDLEAVTPPSGPIADAHAAYIEAWNTQAEGMTLVASALDQQDLTLVAQGNEKLADARALMRKAQQQMRAALDGASN